MAKTYRMSQVKYNELREELLKLKDEGVEQINQQLKEARAFGDLSENSEYDEAKNEQAKLYARISELENILENREIVTEQIVEDGTVGMGSTVVISYDEEGTDTETFKIVGSVEADPMNGLMSDESVIGKAVLGRKEGEWVTYTAPMGTISCKLLSVTKD